MRRLTRWYGANPLHLLALLACFALAGYAATQLVRSRPESVAIWFVGAVVGHDLVLMPLYSIADWSVLAAVRHRAPNLPPVPWINYLRVPAGLSALLLLVWFPLILRLKTHYQAIHHPLPRPVPVALARRDRGAVSAVGHRVRAAPAGRAPGSGSTREKRFTGAAIPRPAAGTTGPGRRGRG